MNPRESNAPVDKVADATFDTRAHTIKRYEEKKNAVNINIDKLYDEARLFYDFLNDISWNKDTKEYVLLFQRIRDNKLDEHSFFAYIYTTNHKYTIAVKTRREVGDLGYAGCVCSNRTPRPGEDHTRGCDLPDGNYNRETFDRIKDAIISMELQQLQMS